MEPNIDLSNLQIVGIVVGLYLVAFAVYAALDFIHLRTRPKELK